MMGFTDKFKMTRQPNDKEIRDKARVQFIKRGEFCDHNPNFPCDKCLDAAIILAKQQAAKLSLTEKNALVKKGLKDRTL
jgi:hypothetical protein